jgi:hypothetical protein
LLSAHNVLLAHILQSNSQIQASWVLFVCGARTLALAWVSRVNSHRNVTFKCFFRRLPSSSCSICHAT